MRFFRLRIRTLMVAVALAAFAIVSAIETARMSSRARSFRSRTTRHAKIEKVLGKSLVRCRTNADAEEKAAAELAARRPMTADEWSRANRLRGSAYWWRANEAHTAQRLAYHAALKQKYSAAARYPWRTVAPDPPEPFWNGLADLPPEQVLPYPHPLELSAGMVSALRNATVVATEERDPDPSPRRTEAP